MGFSWVAKVFRHVCLAAIAIAAAFFAAITLANTAVAQNPGGGGDIDEKPWDTDNLVYTQGTVSYSAENFRVPFHQYRGYSTSAGASPAAKEACAPGGVADAFFQTDTAPGRNDFPVLASNTAGTVWSETATGSKTSGCTAFVDAQIIMSARARSNGGYYLDSQGNLSRRDDVSAARFLAAPAARTRTYDTWSASSPAGTGFSRDACVIADLRVYENRPAGENAEPGVIVNHRTVTYNAAWNLHIASAHPKTASPPRDPAPTTGDPDGCADGSCA